MTEDLAMSVAKAFDELNIRAVADLMNGYMFFVEDYEMVSREDFLNNTNQNFDDETVCHYSR